RRWRCRSAMARSSRWRTWPGSPWRPCASRPAPCATGCWPCPTGSTAPWAGCWSASASCWRWRADRADRSLLPPVHGAQAQLFHRLARLDDHRGHFGHADPQPGGARAHVLVGFALVHALVVHQGPDRLLDHAARLDGAFELVDLVVQAVLVQLGRARQHQRAENAGRTERPGQHAVGVDLQQLFQRGGSLVFRQRDQGGLDFAGGPGGDVLAALRRLEKDDVGAARRALGEWPVQVDAAADALELLGQQVAVFAGRVDHRHGHAAQVFVEAAEAMVHDCPQPSQSASSPSAVRYGSGLTASGLCQTTSKAPSSRQMPMRGVSTQWLFSDSTASRPPGASNATWCTACTSLRVSMPPTRCNARANKCIWL